jgi:hypothetical protein
MVLPSGRQVRSSGIEISYPVYFGKILAPINI